MTMKGSMARAEANGLGSPSISTSSFTERTSRLSDRNRFGPVTLSPHSKVKQIKAWQRRGPEAACQPNALRRQNKIGVFAAAH
jgi:hypothetical protein